MNFHVLSIFPENVYNGLYYSMVEKAVRNDIIHLNCVNIRDFSTTKHRETDDYPYGGGEGMIMKAPPIFHAYKALNLTTAHRVIFMSPQGRTFDQKMAVELSHEKDLVFLCGHYEGVDERVIEEIVTDEVSIGDFVLTGGELAAMVMIDAITRLLPGVLCSEEAYKNESFFSGLLEYPQYTRPYEFNGRTVPDILLSGHHENVAKWRKEQSLERTKAKRPDLYAAYMQEERNDIKK